jgi:hypothetical protein
MKTVAFWAGVFLLLPITGASYYATGSVGAATLALFAVMAFVFLVRLDDIAELTFGPLKTRMRETVNEANATLSQLREVATVTSRLALTELIAGQFMGGMRPARAFALKDEVLASLHRLGPSQDQLQRVEAEWRKGVAILFHRTIRESILADERLENADRHRIADALQDTLNFAEWITASPDEMRSLFRREG